MLEFARYLQAFPLPVDLETPGMDSERLMGFARRRLNLMTQNPPLPEDLSCRSLGQWMP